MVQNKRQRPTGLHLNRTLIIIGAVVVTCLSAAGFFARDMVYRVTGYAAKQVCSFVNVTGQPLAAALSELQEDNPLIQYADVEWSRDDGAVHAMLFGLFKSTAVYRPPLGAVLVFPGYEDAIDSFPRPNLSNRIDQSTMPEPFLTPNAETDALLGLVNKPALEKAFFVQLIVVRLGLSKGPNGGIMNVSLACCCRLSRNRQHSRNEPILTSKVLPKDCLAVLPMSASMHPTTQASMAKNLRII